MAKFNFEELTVKAARSKLNFEKLTDNAARSRVPKTQQKKSNFEELTDNAARSIVSQEQEQQTDNAVHTAPEKKESEPRGSQTSVPNAHTEKKRDSAITIKQRMAIV